MAKVVKHISEIGKREADGSLKLQIYQQKIKITCLLCCRLVFQRIQLKIEKEKMKTKGNAIFKNLCDELHLSRDEIPDECLEEMFPLCKGCCEKVERLWEYNEEIRRIHEKKQATVLDILKSVTEGEVFQPKIRNSNPFVVEAEAKKFTRLREVILKANRDAWKNDSQHNDDLIDESSDESDDTMIVTQNREPITTAMQIGVPFFDCFNPIEAPRTCLSSAFRPNCFKNQDAVDKNCCVFCANTFPNNGKLMQHLLFHVREKPFTCNVCEMEFGQNGTLTRHIRIHTGERPFKCNLCLKTFNQNCTLFSHLAIHTGEKPYKCNLCCKTFNQKRYLGSHLKTHIRK